MGPGWPLKNHRVIHPVGTDTPQSVRMEVWKFLEVIVVDGSEISARKAPGMFLKAL